ncbi:MAG: hypothetical protein M3545_05940 [Acidobacteriota bacterium]|nr:hypothetical protein [Acidobacteriota bacterium]
MSTFALGMRYTRSQINAALGGGVQAYLPTKDGRVVCGTFRLNTNPDAPRVVLPGFGPQIERTAALFASQAECVPIFIKRATNAWEFVGHYRVARISRDPDEIASLAAKAGRSCSVSMVLHLSKC